MSEVDDSGFFNELSQAADNDELAATLSDMETGTTVIFQDGASVTRNEDGWSVSFLSEEDEHPRQDTPEQAFRRSYSARVAMPRVS